MELIEDAANENKLFILDGSCIVKNQKRYDTPVLITHNSIEIIKSDEIKKIFQESKFELIDLFILGIGNGIQPEYWSSFQKSCFLDNCGFEWLPFSSSITMINMLIEEQRKFAAILSETAI